MLNVLVNEEGDLRCPTCGTRNNFDKRRTGLGRAGIMLGAGLALAGTPGARLVATSALPKRLRCQVCNDYCKTPPLLLPPEPLASARAPETSASAVLVDVVIDGYEGAPGSVRAALDAVSPPRFGEDREAVAAAVGAGEAVLLASLPADNAARLLDALRTAGFTSPEVTEPAAASPPDGAGERGSDLLDQLQRLADLHRTGVLTDVEFAAGKESLLRRLG